MSNNNSNNFGSYVGIASGIAVAIGGLAAIGTVLYNEYQEQQTRNNRAISYGPSITGGRRERREEEEQEERRRNLTILEMENERLQAWLEEERVRKIQEERERRRIEAQKTWKQKIEAQRQREKEEEEKKRREEEILRLKTRELAKMDEEFDKFLGVSGNAESSDENDCFLDEINPNRRIKEKFRRTRLQEKQQITESFDQAKTTADEKIAETSSTSREPQVNVGTRPKQNASMNKNNNVAASNSIITEHPIANENQQPKKVDTSCRIEIPSKKSVRRARKRLNLKMKLNGMNDSVNNKSEKLQEQKGGMENIKAVSDKKVEDEEKRKKILEQEKLKLQEFMENQRKIEESRKLFEMKEAERLQKRKAEMIERQMLEEKRNPKSCIEGRKAKEQTRKPENSKSDANDDTEKLEEQKEIEKTKSTSEKKTEDKEKRNKVSEQEKLKLQEFIENQRKIEESRKQFEMKEAERLRKRKEEIMKKEIVKNFTSDDRKVKEQTRKPETFSKSDAIREKEEEDFTKLVLAEVNKRVYEIREADRLEKRNSKIALKDNKVSCDLSGPHSQTQAVILKPSAAQLQIEATANTELTTTKIVDDEKREKIRERRRRKKKLMRSKMKQLKEESEAKETELKNCLQFINSVQTVQKKTELARLQILSRNKQFLNESIKQNRKRF